MHTYETNAAFFVCVCVWVWLFSVCSVSGSDENVKIDVQDGLVREGVAVKPVVGNAGRTWQYRLGDKLMSRSSLVPCICVCICRHMTDLGKRGRRCRRHRQNI